MGLSTKSIGSGSNGFTSVGGAKTYVNGVSMTDDSTFALPSITTYALGNIIVGSGDARATFSIDSSGNVALESATDNIAINSDTDEYFCIGTSVSNPLTIKNRLGSTKGVLVTISYY